MSSQRRTPSLAEPSDGLTTTGKRSGSAAAASAAGAASVPVTNCAAGMPCAASSAFWFDFDTARDVARIGAGQAEGVGDPRGGARIGVVRGRHAQRVDLVRIACAQPAGELAGIGFEVDRLDARGKDAVETVPGAVITVTATCRASAPRTSARLLPVARAPITMSRVMLDP